MMEEHELSIAVVLYNSAGTLAGLTRSLRPAVQEGFAEVIAVDNGSPDNSSTIVRSELPEATLLMRPDNRGFAAGMNAALMEARGRYWMLLNPDVSVSVTALRALVAFMDNHPEIGLASADLQGDDGQWEAPGRATPSIGRTLLELTRLHRILPSHVRARILRGPYWAGGDQVDAGWVPGTAAIVRPEAARAAGPLREELFMYGEDVEWCWRIRRAGWRIGVCSTVQLQHATGSSARRTFGDDDRDFRMTAGMHHACRIMYGSLHARALAAVTALALTIETVAPRRDGPYRRRARVAAGRWWHLTTRQASPPNS